MVVLLSAPRLLLGRRGHVDACALRTLLTGKRQPPVRKAIGWPETVRNEYDLEAVGRVRDTSIRVRPVHVSRYANLPECRHSVQQAG
jgi:hypothetical protein